MTLAELISATRDRLDDNSSPQLWTDAQLKLYINKAADEACIRARIILDSSTTSVCSIAVVAGTSTYAIHPSVFIVHRVYMAGAKRTLERTSVSVLDSVKQGWIADASAPTNYLLDLDNKLVLYPSPVENDTITLTVFRTPLAALSNNSDVPEMPAIYHLDLIDYACHLAYQNQDADTLNIDKALQFEASFTQNFGQKVDARQMEWRRQKANLPVRGRYF